MPKEVIINANSPTCARENAPCTDVFNDFQDTIKPKQEKATLPIITINVITKIGQAYCPNNAGFTIMPTDTKNTAPKKSFNGFITCSIFSVKDVSAKIEPIINAPNADEKPEYVANHTIPKHNPIVVKSKISSFSNFSIFFRNVGTK